MQWATDGLPMGHRCVDEATAENNMNVLYFRYITCTILNVYDIWPKMIFKNLKRLACF